MKVWISERTCPSLSLIPIPSHKLINQCPDPISLFLLYTLLVLFHQSQATVKPETIYSNCITRTRLILPYLESYTQPSLSYGTVKYFCCTPFVIVTNAQKVLSPRKRKEIRLDLYFEVMTC